MSALMACEFNSTFQNLASYFLSLFSIPLQGRPGIKGEKGDPLEISVYMERFRVRINKKQLSAKKKKYLLDFLKRKT